MKVTITKIILLVCSLVVYSNIKKNDCKNASKQAQLDFMKSKYTFHSNEMLPLVNTYSYILNKHYDIKWRFTDSLYYYHCYDSVMTVNLKTKYGSDFLDIAKSLTDSLEQTENWNSDAEYNGGIKEMMKFIWSRLIVDTSNFKDGIKTKLYIILEIDSTGRAINPIIKRSINSKTDQSMIEVIKQMPKWKPAYRYGKPIKQKYGIPLNIKYQ